MDRGLLPQGGLRNSVPHRGEGVMLQGVLRAVRCHTALGRQHWGQRPAPRFGSDGSAGHTPWAHTPGTEDQASIARQTQLRGQRQAQCWVLMLDRCREQWAHKARPTRPGAQYWALSRSIAVGAQQALGEQCEQGNPPHSLSPLPAKQPRSSLGLMCPLSLLLSPGHSG